jgi:hypothetical protein
MERGAATRGKVADAVAGAEAIEIKATIPDHQVDSALTRLGLSAKNDEQRYIYFFDTPNLALLGAGIVARARRVVGDAHDCTVKFRPVNPAEVARKWRKYRDFKIEVDASETALVRAASFSMPVAKGLIKRVAQGEISIAKIFTEAEASFLQTTAGRMIDLASLAVLGPLMAQRWQVVDPACPWPITVELWRRQDGRRLVEVSIRHWPCRRRWRSAASWHSWPSWVSSATTSSRPRRDGRSSTTPPNSSLDRVERRRPRQGPPACVGRSALCKPRQGNGPACAPLSRLASW